MSEAGNGPIHGQDGRIGRDGNVGLRDAIREGVGSAKLLARDAAASRTPCDWMAAAAARLRVNCALPGYELDVRY